MRLPILSVVFFCLTSCKLASVSEAPVSLSSKPVFGAVGIIEESLNRFKFQEAGSPHLESDIRISIKKSAFTKRGLRQYNKKAEENNRQLKIVDSLKLWPEYLILEISDQIGIIHAFNNRANKSILSYLQSTGNNSMVTSMKIYFPEEIVTQLVNATAVYLVNSSPGSNALELINKDNSRKLIHFNEGVAFGYGFSDFCWKENYRGEAVIAALRERGKSCPGITKKDPEKVHEKDVFEKF